MIRNHATASQAMVATSQPLAVEAALKVLQDGGNAVDAAVCATALLGVVEPMSTGIGGDCFALVYEAESGRLHGLNGSGRTPQAAEIQAVRKAGHQAMPKGGILSVSVPGALHAWQALLERCGTRPLGQLLQPSIRAARDGFKVTPIIARDWAHQEDALTQGVNTKAFLTNGCPPRAGELFQLPEMGRSLEQVANHGIAAFYDGPLTQAMVAQSQRLGGWFTHEDFASHTSTWVDPISTSYRGHTVYEIPPNGQGLITLEALNLLEGFPVGQLSTGERIHAQIEATKLAFADAWQYVADPEAAKVPTSGLISKAYAAKRRDLIGDRALQSPTHGFPPSDTVYVTVVDADGNCASMINSIFMHFGSKVVVDGTGIMLQNRAALSELDPDHPNALAGGKRPYHTIIPAMVFRDETPWLCFGVVGGYMQPQAQVQILNHLIDEGMDVGEAVDAPRFCWLNGKQVTLEDGISDEVYQDLSMRGHDLLPAPGFGGFGGAQAILIDPQTGTLSGASDARKDGCVRGY